MKVKVRIQTRKFEIENMHRWQEISLVKARNLSRLIVKEHFKFVQQSVLALEPIIGKGVKIRIHYPIRLIFEEDRA